MARTKTQKKNDSSFTESLIRSNKVRILSESERVGISRLIDGEGSLGVYPSRNKINPSGYQWMARLTVSNKDENLLIWCNNIIGYGKIKPTPRNGYPFYLYTLTADGLRELLPQIKDILITKKHQAEVVLEALELMGKKKSRTEEENERLWNCYHEIRRLNNRFYKSGEHHMDKEHHMVGKYMKVVFLEIDECKVRIAKIEKQLKDLRETEKYLSDQIKSIKEGNENERKEI